jgi:hypothetical protein
MDDYFDNAGERIRGLAKALYIIGMIGSILSGIAIMISLGSLNFFVGVLTGALVAGLGVFAAYVSALMLAAYGVLVQKTEENKAVNQQILDLLKKQDIQNNPPAAPTAPAAPAANRGWVAPPVRPSNGSATVWKCDYCGTDNVGNNVICKKCGQYRYG